MYNKPKKKSKYIKCPKCKKMTTLMICTCGYPIYKDKLKKDIK